MFKIVQAAFIAPGIKRFIIEAPRAARKQKPGQFVILRLYEQGERIPLTIERSAPVEFLADDPRLVESGAVCAHGIGRARCIRTPALPIAGSEFELPLSVAIMAIGTSANPIVQSTTPGLETNKRGYINANPETQRTSRKGVFAGGDTVTGSATVILAMGAGRRAAKSIHQYLSTGVW